MNPRTINIMADLIKRKDEINNKLSSLMVQVRESLSIDADSQQKIILQILQIQDNIINFPETELKNNVAINTLWNQLEDLRSNVKLYNIDVNYILDKRDSIQTDKKPDVVNPTKYSISEIHDWLFDGVKNPDFPESQLHGRKQDIYKPKININEIAEAGNGNFTSRIKIYSGGVTDLKIENGKKGAIATSNNGDLLTGCGFAVAKAIVNATGAGLQTELYNRFGVPGVMEVPEFGSDQYQRSEGRGYAITCDSYDMRATHNIDKIEVLSVPMYSEEGIANMYYEALVHSKDLDYIVIPMAGMTHPVLNNNEKKSAMFALSAVDRFIHDYPDSKLNVVFTIFDNPKAEAAYNRYANFLDNPVKGLNSGMLVEHGPLVKSAATYELEKLVKELALANQSEIDFKFNIFSELEISIHDTTYNLSKILEHQADFEQLELTDNDISAFKDYFTQSNYFSELRQLINDLMISDTEFKTMYEETFNYLSEGEKLAAIIYSEDIFYKIINNFLRYDGKKLGTYEYPEDIKGIILGIAVMHNIFKHQEENDYIHGPVIRHEVNHPELKEQRREHMERNKNQTSPVTPFVQKGFFSASSNPDVVKQSSAQDYNLMILIHDANRSNTILRRIPSLSPFEAEKVAPHRSQFIFKQASDSDVIEAIPIRSPTGLNSSLYSRDDMNTRSQLAELLNKVINIPAGAAGAQSSIAAIQSFKDNFYLFVCNYDSLSEDEKSKEYSKLLYEYKSLDEYLRISNTKEQMKNSHIFDSDFFRYLLTTIVNNKINIIELSETELKMCHDSAYYAVLAQDKDAYVKLCESYSEFDTRYQRDLEIALKDNSIEIALLARAKSGPDIRQEVDQHLMNMVVEDHEDEYEIIKLLLEGINKNILETSLNARTLFVKAVVNNWPDIVETLLRAEVNSNFICKGGFTPLYMAKLYGHDEIVKILLVHKDKIDINIRDAYGETQLGIAAAKGDAKVAAMLINNGADPNIADNEGFTPLYIAKVRGHDEIVATLLAHKDKLNLNIQDENGQTQLHIAALEGDLEVAKMLINNGADPDVKDMDGKTPFDLAQEAGDIEIMHLLKWEVSHLLIEDIRNLALQFANNHPNLKSINELIAINKNSDIDDKTYLNDIAKTYAQCIRHLNQTTHSMLDAHAAVLTTHSITQSHSHASAMAELELISAAITHYKDNIKNFPNIKNLEQLLTAELKRNSRTGNILDVKEIVKKHMPSQEKFEIKKK